MTDTDAHRTRGFRIDGQTTISLALVLTLIVGVFQYGRQSQRVDDMNADIVKLTARVETLTAQVTRLVAQLNLQTEDRH